MLVSCLGQSKPQIEDLSDVLIFKEEKELEQVPSELSIEHFAQMRLSGTGLTLESVLADENVYTRYSITYKSNGLTISGIMNIPKGDGPFPLVVLNHGFIAPSVYTNGRGLRREQDYLARQGFAVIHPDYRGYAFSDPSPDERMIYDASLEYSMDSINAIHAVRNANLPNVDTSKVGMLGHSLGGGIALNISVAHPDMIDAVILYAPVHSDAWENFLRWRDMREEGDRTRVALGTRQENPGDWDALSSLTHLSQVDDPILLFHGTADKSVPKEWSDFLSENLEQLGKNVTYIEYEGEKHEFIQQWNDFMQQSSKFLRSNLMREEWIPPLHQDSKRITKKPFGVHITPQNSPIEQERFSGYHTGVDYELLPGESAQTVAVRAACAGKVLYKEWVKGYGGVVVQECLLDGELVTTLYGHLDISSVEIPLNTILQPGDIIGYLGNGFTRQTDNERAHLHFAIHHGTELVLLGYVDDNSQLQDWINPVEIFY